MHCSGFSLFAANTFSFCYIARATVGTATFAMAFHGLDARATSDAHFPCLAFHAFAQRRYPVTSASCVCVQKADSFTGYFVSLACVFIHIVGSIFVFDISSARRPVRAMTGVPVSRHDWRRSQTAILRIGGNSSPLEAWQWKPSPAETAGKTDGV